MNKESEEAVRNADPMDVPALGISVQAQAGDRRTIIIQTHMGRDDSEEEINTLLDRLQRVIDRQQASYDLDAEMEGFHKVGGTLRLNIDGLPIAEANKKKELAALAVKLQEFETAKEAEYQDGYAEWSKKGGRGTYAPKGFRANKIAALTAEIEKARAAIEAKPKDEAQNREQVMKTIAHFQDDLKKRRARINHLLGLLGREPNLEYQDVEAFKPET